MAGFQLFPIPRRLNTSGYWNYVNPSVSKKNAVSLFISLSIGAIAFARYFILKSVLTQLYSKLIPEPELS